MQVETPATKSVDAGSHGSSNVRAYYVSQLSGWTLYGVLQYVLAPAPRGLRPFIFAAAWCGTGFLGTHLLRAYANRRRLQTIAQLIFPFAVAVLVIPAAMNAARLTVGILFWHDRFEPDSGWVILAHSIPAVLVIAVWCAVFVSANEARRRRLAETEALRLALVAQVSQFHALRSQLNPHFLFNCLNSLRELIDEDPDRAKQVVSLLSDLLRYTLRADRVETVSLKEELRAVEDYLSLEKVRFEERLHLRLNIDPDSLSARVPPMLVQTLAENGVKHGIARLPAGGDLSIATLVSEGNLNIEVTNSGTLSTKGDGSSAVGLDNARERLRLMYGDGASLIVTALDQARVRAAVVIPIRANGEGP
jgi:hypothetical protein